MSKFIARVEGFHQWTGVGRSREEAVARLLEPTMETPGLAGKVASTRTLEGSDVVVQFYGWGLESEPTRAVRAPLIVQQF